MEHMETYHRLQKFAEAKAEDKALLQKQREIRIKVGTHCVYLFLSNK